MSPVAWPILYRDKHDPATLELLEEPQDLLAHVREFADLIHDFEAWDSESRRVDLRGLAESPDEGGHAADVRVFNSPAPNEAQQAVREYLIAIGSHLELTADETPAEFLERLNRVDRRG